QVWMISQRDDAAGEPRLTFQGESDAHIVQGLIAVLLAIHSGQTAQEILDTDTLARFQDIGLKDHLTPQRSNGLASMITRIRAEAERTRDEA
ncbi:MAG: SufE family protein, partial [Pseudomonadota bacterium]